MTDGSDTTLLIAILVAALAAAIVAGLVWRGARRRRRNRAPVLSERSGNERPYVRPPPTPPPAHAGVADEVAAATTDVLRDVLSVEKEAAAGSDDLQRLKGVGPKLATRLRELGITSYAQLAHLGGTEVARLDERLGPFSGRVSRDRLVEQAQFLARGDTDGFEARFGKLGG
ncbi:MAG TPA: helix-hairpin-helix domain-containing protein [Allosphingosinicella sp.]|jgi:predicted flap endonuclease-1-like 5' DNA nuclease